MNKTKRFLAIITVMALICSLFCITSFAVETEQESPTHFENYCFLGDSIPSGYGLERNEANKATNPKGRLIEGSYPQIVSQYIGASTTSVLARDGFTTMEALRLLDPEYEEELKNDAYKYLTSEVSVTVMASMTDEEFEELRSHAEEDVKNADIITLNFGNNDTMTYAMLKSSIDTYYETLGGTATPNIDASYDDYMENLESLIGGFGDLGTTISSLLSTGNYYTHLMVDMLDGYTQFISRWDRLVARVRELNSDAQIYVVGMYNPFQTTTLSDSIPIQAGRVFDAVVETINLYMNTVSSQRSQYVYVDVPDTEAYEFPSLLSSDFWSDFTLRVHPTANGHAYMANKLIAAIENNNCTVTENVYAGLQDIDVRQCYFDSINYVLQHNIMTGSSGQAFDSDQLITTAMVAQSLYKIAGKPAVTSDTQYSDIIDGMWYSDAMKWASEAGIISAYEDGTLRPMNGVTFCTVNNMIKAFAEYSGFGTKINEGTIFNGIEGGYSSDTSVTRGQLAQILTNLCKSNL